MARTDLVSSIALLIFGLVVAFESWRMPRFESIGGSLMNAPGLVPGLLGLTIALLGGVMLGRFLVARRRARTEPPATPPESPPLYEQGQPDTLKSGTGPYVDVSETPSVAKASNVRVIATLVLGVAFAAVLIGRMPFWLAVFLFVFASIVYNERAALRTQASAVRVVLIAAAIAGATGFAVPFVFERIFLVTLP